MPESVQRRARAAARAERDATARRVRRRAAARAARSPVSGVRLDPMAGAAGRRSRPTAPGPPTHRRRQAVSPDGFFTSPDNGWVEVICGVMFSGKSEELIRRVRRAMIARKSVQVFKSHLDERYSGIYQVSSHDGRTTEAIPVDTPEQIQREIGRAHV